MPTVPDKIEPTVPGRTVASISLVDGALLKRAEFNESTRVLKIQGVDSDGDSFETSITIASRKTGSQIISDLDTHLGNTGWRSDAATQSQLEAIFNSVLTDVQIDFSESTWDGAETNDLNLPDSGGYVFPDDAVRVSWSACVELNADYDAYVVADLDTLGSPPTKILMEVFAEDVDRTEFDDEDARLTHSTSIFVFPAAVNARVNTAVSTSAEVIVYWRKSSSGNLVARISGTVPSTWVNITRPGQEEEQIELIYDRLILKMHVMRVADAAGA